MEFPEGINPDQEYSQLMYIMDKKEWPALNQHLHKPEVFQTMMFYMDAMTQRKQATNQLHETYLVKTNNEQALRNTLRDCMTRNKTIEDEQLKNLTMMIYGREITYDVLVKDGYLRYFFE
jgi:hypothetical protein